MSNIYSQHKPGNSDDLYLKLKDGDAVKMRLVSDPAIVLFKEGQKPRYAWKVINHNSKKAQVYGAGISVYSQIADLSEDWGDPSSYDITIRRKGSGQFDTEYSVTPMKNNTEPTQEQLAEAEKIDLLNATKGKLLAAYIEDGVLPDPVTSGVEPTAQSEPLPQPPSDEEMEKPINLDEIPF